MKLLDLDLSVRAYNCLRHGCLTDDSPIDEVLQIKTPSTLMNLGRKTYQEIIGAMAQEFAVDKIKSSPIWTNAPESWKLDLLS